MNNLDIFVIHLERVEPLFIRLKKQLDDFGLSYNVFPAFDGEKIKNPTMKVLKRMDNPMYKQFEYKRTYSPGSLSCSLSHIAIIKYAKMMGLKSYMVLEEDAVLSKDFLERLEELKNVPEDADMIYLGGISHIGLSSKKYKINENLYDAKMMQLFGTHAMVIYEKGYDIISDSMESHTDFIDSSLMYAIRKKYTIKAYALIPFCVYQDNDFSYTLNKYTKNRHLTKTLYSDNEVRRKAFP